MKSKLKAIKSFLNQNQKQKKKGYGKVPGTRATVCNYRHETFPNFISLPGSLVKYTVPIQWEDIKVKPI